MTEDIAPICRIKKAGWERYREKLIPIIQQVADRNGHDFTDEIDTALMHEHAFLFIADDGFMVLKPTVRKGITWITVLFAYSWGGDAIHRYQAQIETMTRQVGGRGVEAFTKVAALAPILEQEGYFCVEDGDDIQHWQKAL